MNKWLVLIEPLTFRWYLLLAAGLIGLFWLAGLLGVILPSAGNIKLLSWMKRQFIPVNLVLNLILAGCLMMIGGLVPEVIQPQGPLFEPVTFDADSPLTITFNRPVYPHLKAGIAPAIEGEWHYGFNQYGRLLPDAYYFVPKTAFLPDTEYVVSLEQIRPVFNLFPGREQRYLFTFKTPATAGSTPSDVAMPAPSPILTPDVLAPSPTSTPAAAVTSATTGIKLKVPLYKQHYTFTCYSAAAQMVLAYRGVKDIGEFGFLDLVGYDTTQRDTVKNVWGDPDAGIVGHYQNGGYGVHWDPVAKAMDRFVDVEVKRQWNLTELLQTVKLGNPVMVWWVNGVWPAKELSWQTPAGTPVRAVNGMHVEIVTGFDGTEAAPKTIYTNDPWRGYRRYQPAAFTQLWRWFDNTAIIVYDKKP